MTDSLVFADVELLGGGVTQSAGWAARLRPGWDLGSAEPETTVVESLLLDGERVIGDASGDRAITLQVLVVAATRQQLSAGVARLQVIANARSSTLLWTPSGGQPAIFDTWRGRTSVVWNLKQHRSRAAMVTITLTALPFARNPSRKAVTVGTPSLLLDSIDTANAGHLLWGAHPGTSHSVAWAVEANTAIRTQGTNSNVASFVAPASGYYDTVAVVPHNFGAPVDLHTYDALAVDVRIDGSGVGVGALGPYVQLLLVDSGGGAAVASATVSQVPGLGTFATMFVPLPSAAFINLNAISSITLSAYGLLYAPAGTTVTEHIDNLRAVKSGAAVVGVTNGGTYLFSSIGGTARCQVALQATRAGGISSLVVHKAPAEARADYTPLVPYGSVGATIGSSHALPTAAGSTNGVRFDGTHAIWLAGVAMPTAGSRTVTVTFTQAFGDPVGFGLVTSTISRTCADTDILNGLLPIGFLTLPGRDVARDNTASSMTVTVTDSLSGTTTVQDVLVLDTRGPTTIVGQSYTRDTLWLDEPAVDSGVGEVLMGSTIGGAANGRASAVSVWDYTTTDPGPLSFEPGDNLLLVYCPQGAPIVTASYAERYLAEAV